MPGTPSPSGAGTELLRTEPRRSANFVMAEDGGGYFCNDDDDPPREGETWETTRTTNKADVSVRDKR